MVKIKCSKCKEEIKGEVAYRYGKPLCINCYKLPIRNGKAFHRRNWESVLNTGMEIAQ